MPPKKEKKCKNCDKDGHSMIECTEPTKPKDKTAAPTKKPPPTSTPSSTPATGVTPPAVPVTSQTDTAGPSSTVSTVNASTSDATIQSSSSKPDVSVTLPVRGAHEQSSSAQKGPTTTATAPRTAQVATNTVPSHVPAPAAKSSGEVAGTVRTSVQAEAGPSATPTPRPLRAVSKPPSNFKQKITEKYPFKRIDDWSVQKEARVATRATDAPNPKLNLSSAQDQWERGLRTDFGSAGTLTKVIANYVAISKNPNALYQYQISVAATWLPEATPTPVEHHRLSKKEKRQILEGLAAHHSLSTFTGKFALENHENLWSITPLFNHTAFPSEVTYTGIRYQKANGVVKYADVDLRFFRQMLVDQKIQSEAQIPTNPNVPVGNAPGNPAGVPANAAPIQMNQNESESALTIRGLNALVASYPSSVANHLQQGLNKFFLNTTQTELTSCLHTLFGFFSSARPGITKGQILLNLNTATKVFITPMLVSQFMNEFERVLPNRYGEALKGLKVRITYERPVRKEAPGINSEAHRIKQIASIGTIPVNRQSFPVVGNPPSMLVSNYMQDLHITPHTAWNHLPCVNVGRDDPNDPGAARWIPPTHLEILPDQPLKSGLTKHFADRIVTIACRMPTDNLSLISGLGLQTMGIYPAQRHFEPLELTMDTQLLRIPARFLKLPNLQYLAINSRTQQKMITPQGASWALVNSSFVQPNPNRATKIGIMNLVQGQEQGARVFADSMDRQLRLLGFGNVTLIIDNVFDYGQAWVDFQARVRHSYNTVLKDCTVVVILLPDRESYPFVRVVADILVGRATVCSLKGIKQATSAQYCANVAMKISAKLAGRTHNIISNDFSDTMVVGADVSHPGPGSDDKAMSFAGVVASVDREAYTYLAGMRSQEKRLETIENMRVMIKDRLRAYFDRNGKLPARILFYRDGVSESQYQILREAEIPAVKMGYADAVHAFGKDKGQKLQLTFVVVGKRHHTRFFATGNAPVDRTGNLAPGLVVDQVVTSSSHMDFYLQSHAALKGTARSSHYFVLCNEMKLTSDRLQALTLNLCFNFARATKGISICAPARYADLLCDRARAYAGAGYPIPPDRDPWHEGVRNHMFYV